MGTVMTMRTPAENALLEAFEKNLTELGGADLRRAAFAGVAERGLPHRRVEAWKYTDLRAKLAAFPPLARAQGQGDVSVRSFGGLDAATFVIRDGVLLSSPALPAGVSFEVQDAVSESDTKGSVIADLNAAFVPQVLRLRVAAGVRVEKPLHVAFVASSAEAASVFSRVKLEVGAGATVMLYESADALVEVAHNFNDVIEVVLGDEAQVRHVRMGNEGLVSVHLSALFLTMGAKSDYARYALQTQASLARAELYAVLEGDHALMRFNGAQLVGGTRHADTTLVVEHQGLHCESRELQKSVLAGSAMGVFQGKIIVQPEAQKTDGRMMSQALLLSDDASMMNKPELEIFADDVACGHGATCGALDDDQLFYLMARGVPKLEAEALLIEAFVSEAFEDLAEDEALYGQLLLASQIWLKDRV
jgi:Fe-S cluster assembly protein SufD